MSDIVQEMLDMRARLDSLIERLRTTPDDVQVDFTEAAAFLSISKSQFYEIADRGEIPVVEIGAKTRRVCMADLRRFRDERRRRAAA